MHVLVVDDNADVRLLVRYALGHYGVRVTEAEGGTQALAILASAMIPDLVLLDVQMPDMDGWETLEAIRRTPSIADLPVVLCTVKARPEDTVRGWELDCDGYVTKPFDIDALHAQVREVAARTMPERLAERAAGLAEAREAAAAINAEP